VKVPADALEHAEVILGRESAQQCVQDVHGLELHGGVGAGMHQPDEERVRGVAPHTVLAAAAAAADSAAAAACRQLALRLLLASVGRAKGPPAGYQPAQPRLNLRAQG
jgi:hypothetical protein